MPIPEAGPTEATRLAFAPDGKTLASGGSSGEVGLWEVASGRRVARIPGHRRDGGNAFEVQSLGFSPDGKTLAVVGLLRIEIEQFHAEYESELRLIDVGARSERWTIPGIAGGPRFPSAGFSPDGTVLALTTASIRKDGEVGEPGGVRLFEVATGKQRGASGEGKRGLEVAYSGDGSMLVTADPSWITLRDPVDGRERAVLENGGFGFDGSGMALSPDGRTLATTAGGLRLWDVPAALAPPTAGGHRFGVTGLAYSPDGRTLASASLDRTVKLWDLATKLPRSTLAGHGAEVILVAYSPDGRAVASVDSDGKVRIWDAATGACRATLQGPGSEPRLLAFAPDGRSVCLIASEDDRPAEIRRWDANDGEPLPPHQAAEGPPGPLAFSPDGGLVVSSDGTRVEIRDARTWALRSAFTVKSRFPALDQPRSLLVSRDGETVFRMTTNRSLTIRRASRGTWGDESFFDYDNGAESIQLASFPAGRYLAATPDSRRVAAYLEGVIRVFDAATRRPVAAFPTREADVRWLAFAPDGRSLAAGDSEGDILIYNLNR